jgi:hypothetical protein
MKTFGELEVKPKLLISALDGRNRSASRSGRKGGLVSVMGPQSLSQQNGEDTSVVTPTHRSLLAQYEKELGNWTSFLFSATITLSGLNQFRTYLRNY